MANTYGAAGVYPTPRGQPSNAFDLQPGAARLIPAGTWMLGLDGYSCLQEFDPVQGQWLQPGGEASNVRYVNSDGNNYRAVNLSGCIVGATVTTAGSGYTTATPPTVSFSTGGATATAIVGGAVSTAVTVTNGGTGYTYAPLVFFDAPPTGAGYQATGYCTLTSGAVSSVTITNQGAGYASAPNVYFVNDPRDVTGTQAAASTILTGAGTVTQLLITNHGAPQTTLQPTIAFSSGSAAAFPIMVRSIGAFTVTTAGSGYTGTVEISGLGNGYTGAANVLTNPKWTTGLVRTRKASIISPLVSTGISAGGQQLLDGGIYAGSNPTPIVYGPVVGLLGTSGQVGVPAFTWANQVSTLTLQPV